MKRAIFSALVVVVLAGLTGCMTQHGKRPLACTGGSCAQAPENCQSCNDPGNNCNNGQDPGRAIRCRDCGGRGCQRCCGQQANASPATGAITYPYYTTRGPRDFLARNPPGIGP